MIRPSRLVLRALVLAGTGLVLTNCTFDETTPPLGVAAPLKFDNAAKTAAGAIPADWPRLFGSPELTRLGRATVAGNLDIAAAAARIVQAQAQAEIASAAQLPLLSGNSSVQRDFSSSSGRTSLSTGVSNTTSGTVNAANGTAGTGTTATTGTGAGTGGTVTTGQTVTTGATTISTSRSSVSNLYQLGLTASYEVDFWGRNAYASVAAEQNALASQFSRDTVVLSSVAALVNTYFSLLSAQDRLRIAQNNIASSQDVLEAIRGRLTVGTVTALEVAEQESVVAQQRANLPLLNLQAEQARTQIAILMGRTPESVRVVGGSLDRLRPPVIPAGLPADVLRRRPDIAANEAALRGADANIQSARAAFFPTVTLTGNGGLESTLLRNLLRPESLFGSISAGLTQPLFDGYALQGQLDQARGIRREGLETYRKSIIQALVDVENALLAVRRNTEHERALAAVVAASQRAYDVTKERLKLGTIDIVTVLNTQLTLFGAQDALAVARLARYQSFTSLAQALGGGWTFPKIGPVEPAIAFPAPFTYGVPGHAIVPPYEAATETHALPGQPPIPVAGTVEAPGLGPTQAKR